MTNDNIVGGLPEYLYIQTSGGPKQIKDANAGDCIVSGGSCSNVLAKLDCGVKSIISIQHRFGEIQCAPNHPIAIFTSVGKYEFIPASELTIGDRLVWDSRGVDGENTNLPNLENENYRKNKPFFVPDIINEDIAWLFGTIHVDGYVSDREVEVKEDIEHYKVLEKISYIFKNHFGLDSKVKSAPRKSMYRIRIYSNPIAEWFSKHIKSIKTAVNISDFIFSANRNTRFAYLAGVFDADGKTRQDGSIWQVSTGYEFYANQIVAILTSLGIGCNKTTPSLKIVDGQYVFTNMKYEVKIIGKINRKNWINGISPHSVSGKADNLSPNLNGKSPVDFSWTSEMANNYVQKVITYKKSKSVTHAYLLELDPSTPSIYLPSPVISISTGEDIQTWNIQTENNHQLTIGGVVVGNEIANK